MVGPNVQLKGNSISSSLSYLSVVPLVVGSGSVVVEVVKVGQVNEIVPVYAVVPDGSSVPDASGSTVDPAFGSNVVTALGSNVVTAFGSTVVTAFGSTVVAASGSTVVEAFGSTVVAAFGSTVVAAFGSAVVPALGSAVVPPPSLGAVVADAVVVAPFSVIGAKTFAIARINHKTGMYIKIETLR